MRMSTCRRRCLCNLPAAGIVCPTVCTGSSPRLPTPVIDVSQMFFLDTLSSPCPQLDGRNILVREDRGGFQHDGDSPPRRARGEYGDRGDRGDYGRRERSRSPMAAPADMQCYEVQILHLEPACMPQVTAPRCLPGSTAAAAEIHRRPTRSRAACVSGRRRLTSLKQLLCSGRFPQPVNRCVRPAVRGVRAPRAGLPEPGAGRRPGIPATRGGLPLPTPQRPAGARRLIHQSPAQYPCLSHKPAAGAGQTC